MLHVANGSVGYIALKGDVSLLNFAVVHRISLTFQDQPELSLDNQRCRNRKKICTRRVRVGSDLLDVEGASVPSAVHNGRAHDEFVDLEARQVSPPTSFATESLIEAAQGSFVLPGFGSLPQLPFEERVGPTMLDQHTDCGKVVNQGFVKRRGSHQ